MGRLLHRQSPTTTAVQTEYAARRHEVAALLDALQEPNLPPKLPELLQFDNVVITPHCAGRAPEARTAATALILANLNACFAGKPLPSPVSFSL